MANSGRVLVIGEDTCAFLATIRSLGRLGLDVHVAWCPLDSPAIQSRYVNRVHTVPPYDEQSDNWIRVFQQLLRYYKFDLVLPIIDRALLPLQLHRSEIEQLARVCLLPDDVYHICSDKSETYKLAEREGVPLPPQRTIHNLSDALECAAEFGYPLVLKPIASVCRENPGTRGAVRKARNEPELLMLMKRMAGEHELLIQKNFIGSGTGVEVLCKDGDILTAFQHERIHEPLLGGGSSYRKSVPLHAGMYAATSRLMKALRYTGVAMVEFKENRKSGKWILIEINSRFWGSLPLSIAAGLDFPQYLYQMLIEDRVEFPREYRTGLFARNWTKDMHWFLANLRADKRDPQLQSRSISSVLLEIKNILFLRERSDTLAFDDMRPAWIDLKDFFAEKVFRVAKLAKSYRRIEQKRLFHLYRSARTVLVMCYGNICRSPFAAALLQDISPNKNVTSSGTHLQAGRCSPSEAIEAASGFGIDLTDHKSRIATIEELRSADLIIIFDRVNWLAIRSICPDALSKVAYLGAADPATPLEIPDPFGSSVEAFEKWDSMCQFLLQRLVSRS